MIRTYKAPRHPELLGAIIAALDSQASEASPANRAEERFEDRFRRHRIKPTAAKRLLANFEALPKGTRERLLGKIAARDFKIPARPGEPPKTGPSTVTVPADLLIDRTKLHGILTSILTTGITDSPTYTIRYQGLFCQKETSWDGGTNSDEVYVITSAVHIRADGTNVVRTERHPQSAEKVYGDVDDTEERIGPVAAAWAGNADPVSLTVMVFEHDYGDPDKYRDEVDTIVKAAVAAVTALYPALAPLGLLAETITDAINWLLDTGDDLISTQTVVLPRVLLESYSTQGYTVPYQGYKTQIKSIFPVSYEVVPVTTHLQHHFTTEHTGSGADYIVGFDVIRDPPFTRPPIIL